MGIADHRCYEVVNDKNREESKLEGLEYHSPREGVVNRKDVFSWENPLMIT